MAEFDSRGDNRAGEKRGGGARRDGRPGRDGGFRREGGPRKPAGAGKGSSRDGGFRRDGKPHRDGKPSFDRKPSGEKRGFEGKPHRDGRHFEDRQRKPHRDGDRHFRDGGSFGERRSFDRKPRRDGDALRDGKRFEGKPHREDGRGKPHRDGKPSFDRKPSGEKRGFEGKPHRDGKPSFEGGKPRRDGDAPRDGKRFEGGKPRRDGDRPAREERPFRFYRSNASPARQAALEVFRDVRVRDAYAQDLIAARIDNSKLSLEDRAFATRLVLGAVSCLGTLDEIVDRALDDPSDVKADVRDALRLAAYEIVFLGKSPHAAVDQGVEMVRSIAPSAAGLGNAVLRRIVALRTVFPFGDPTCDIEALARLHAFPVWLAKRLVADLGAQAAHEFMRASNEPAPLFVGLSAVRVADEAEEAEVVSVLKASRGEPVAAGADGLPVPGCYRLAQGRVLQDGRVRRLFNQGKLVVSDAASQLVAYSVLPDEKPASFLEVGAGRGTKTILLQSGAVRRWGSQMAHTALDNHGFKTELLGERAQRYGIELAETVTGDATKLSEAMGERLFDAVFVDAPCSGLGTLRRHPEIRWRLTEERIGQLADLQLALLRSCAQHVAPGGRLAYATCTVTHAENNGVVKRFLESEEGASFKLAPIAGRSCLAPRLTVDSPDAHFAVCFERVK